ncbi:MAG: hypothetical protein PHQ75_05220 [Thermoguttaceae bacterium]|nr:hypothetical protein [Thermoguttaceae bacterium]
MSIFCFRSNAVFRPFVGVIGGLILGSFVFCGCCQECSTGTPNSVKPAEQTKPAPADQGNENVPNTSRRETSPVQTIPEEIKKDTVKSDVPVTLETCGAKVDFNKDGTVKAVDFSSAKLSADSVFNEADLVKLSSARVVRGSGPIFPAVFKACGSMNRLTEFLWTQPAADAKNFDFFSSKSELKKIRLTGLKTDSVAQVVKTLGTVTVLADLDVSGTSLGDTDLAQFAVGGFTKLVRLNLYQTGTTDRGVESLVPLAGQLVWLNLDATAVTDAGCKHIAKFTSLTFLHLGRTAISDVSAGTIGSISSLKKLHVTRTAMTAKGFDVLKEKLPGCEIVTVAADQEKK